MADQRIAAALASATGTGTHETTRAEARGAADGALRAAGRDLRDPHVILEPSVSALFAPGGVRS